MVIIRFPGESCLVSFDQITFCVVDHNIAHSLIFYGITLYFFLDLQTYLFLVFQFKKF